MKKTNKTFKRFAAITSASLLAACAMAPVFTSMTSYAAANEITFSGETNAGSHAYTAIQIFTGVTEAADSAINDATQGTLKNIDWAYNASLTTDDAKASAISSFLGALDSDTTIGNDFTSSMTAAEVAGVLATYGNNSDKAKAFAKIVANTANTFVEYTSSTSGETTKTTKISVSNDGYYVIKETSTDVDGITAYILGVYDAGTGATVNVKSGKASFEKYIKDENDSSTEDVNEWQGSADYDINDKVPFQLKANLPSNYDSYKYYQLIFHDDLNKKSGTPAVDVFGNPEEIVVYVDLNKNGKSDADEILTKDTDYTVTIHDTDKTENETFDCDFEVTISNLVGKKEGISSTTPVYVEYKAELLSAAVLGNPGNWNDGYLEYSNNPNVEADGDGDSKSETPVKSAVAFTYQVVINKTDGTTKKPLTGAVFELFKKNEAGTYVSVEKLGVDAGNVNTNISTFTFTGLDDGEYKLVEVSTPNATYNAINDMYFKVDATHTSTVNGHADGILTELTGTNQSITYDTDKQSAAINLTANTNNDTLSATIENFSGAALPGTGGIGTTIFYLGGGAMAAIGGIYLISKRRMRKSEE